MVFVLSILVVCGSYAEEEGYAQNRQDTNPSWQITAMSLSYREKDSVYVAKGDVIISRENQTLFADEAVYSRESGIVRVNGNVRHGQSGRGRGL